MDGGKLWECGGMGQSNRITMSFSTKCRLKAKFHYTSWLGAGSKPNSIMLSDSNQLRTSSEPASVMEFGFKQLDADEVVLLHSSV